MESIVEADSKELYDAAVSYYRLDEHANAVSVFQAVSMPTWTLPR